MLLEGAMLRESRDEYYTADSLQNIFETVSELCMVKFLREVGLFYLIWMIKTSRQFRAWSILELMQLFWLQVAHRPGHYNQAWLIYLENEKSNARRLPV